jgi:hypothetical protein
MNTLQLLHLTSITATTFLVLLFVTAVLHKLSDVTRFSGYVMNYDLLPKAWVTPVTYLLISVEIMITLGLMIPAFNAVAISIAILLLASYAFAMFINIRRGNTQIECGCGGPVMYVSYNLILRNSLIILIAIPALFSPATEINVVDTFIAVSCGALLFLMFTIAEKLLANFHHSHHLNR